MKHTSKTLLSLSLIAISALGAHAAPVGMAARVVGKPEWKDGNAWKPLHVLQRFEEGDAVRCGPGESAIVVLFATGGRYTVGAGATGTVAANNVAGAKPMGAPSGASAAVAQRLSGARTGAVMARPVTDYERLHAQKPGEVVAKIPPAHDWLRADERSFTVNPIDNAQTYTFTLFDPKDYVIFSQSVTPAGGEVRVTFPEGVKLDTRKPYTWRLHGFKDGRVQVKSRWGITTVLSDDEAAQLIEAEKASLTPEGKLPADLADLAILADLYRNYGVLQNTLEVLDSSAFSTEPNIKATKGEVFAQAGLYAQGLAEQARRASEAMGGDN